MKLKMNHDKQLHCILRRAAGELSASATKTRWKRVQLLLAVLFRGLVKMIDSHLPADTKKIKGSSHHFQLC